MNLINNLLRTGEKKKVRQLETLAKNINQLEEFFEGMSDSELKAVTDDLKRRYWGDTYSDYSAFLEGKLGFLPDGERLEGKNAPGNPQVLSDEVPLKPVNGETLEQLLPEAFAAVREASKRTIGQRHFDVQLMGGAALFNNNISEMKTGEGKTLVATLPAYLGSIAGLGVHVVTVNDYLAEYQSELMGRIFRFLGLKTGCILSNLTPAERRVQYNADITYGTNNEFGFDYLRDNMAMRKEDLVQRGHFFAIVDEVDSILIDEARTPLIISGHAAGDLNKQYQDFARFVMTLKKATNTQSDVPSLMRGEKEEPNGDYEVDEKKRTVGVLDSAIDKLENHLGIENLYDAVNTPLIQFLQNAIKAKELFLRDRDYIVDNGEVKIVDEHTGRVLDGRRYNEGLHQAIEAKEGVKIQAENQTYATITLQNYFRLYSKLAGMTGTAETEAAEFMSTYNLGVIPIPTNKPMIREDKADFVFRTEAGKFQAIVNDVKERNQLGQPVLLGTASVEKSELLSREFKNAGIKHNVLNAKQHAHEASIIALSGRLGAVTVATNMAGRGTDIMLGGNSEFIARQKMKAKGFDIEEETDRYDKEWPKVLKEAQAEVEDEKQKVTELGGLYVIGTERHESRRIDNQLRGRSGRQGDPGESRFFISMEDDLMRLFNSARAQQVMSLVDFPEDQPIENSLLTRSIRNAQAQVEGRNFEIRKNVLKYDEIMNKQRKVVYSERKKVLFGVDISLQIKNFINNVVADYISNFTFGTENSELDLEKLIRGLKSIYPVSISSDELVDAAGGEKLVNDEFLIRELSADAQIQYQNREEFAGEKIIREIERNITLQIMDRAWREHLASMDYLREGIGLRAMAQKDPLVEYTNEAAKAFNEMNFRMQGEIVQMLFNITIALEDEKGVMRQMTPENQIVITNQTSATQNSDKKSVPEVGKNEPCPCGSGKKYKMCHGR